LEEQVRGFGFERQVADLVDDDQPVAAQPGELLGLEADLLANLVTHAAQVAEADAIDRKQFTHVVNAHALEHIARFEAVAELDHGGVGVGGKSDGLEALGRGRMGGRQDFEDAAPVAQHVFGIVEALAKVAGQGV